MKDCYFTNWLERCELLCFLKSVSVFTVFFYSDAVAKTLQGEDMMIE